MPLISQRRTQRRSASTRRPETNRDEVHVYDIDLRLDQASVDGLADLLDDCERTRARRFATKDLARKYVGSHGGVRIALSRYLDLRPEELRFVHNAHGKPALDPGHASAMRFNLSHSGEKCVVAITENREIGIDVEAIRPFADWRNIALRFFSRRESTGLETLPEAVAGTAFFATWARKEAYVKAVGLGLSIDLTAFEVEVDPRREARLLFVEDSDQGPERWCMRDIDVGSAYRGAVVVEGRSCVVRVQELEWPPAPLSGSGHRFGSG